MPLPTDQPAKVAYVLGCKYNSAVPDWDPWEA